MADTIDPKQAARQSYTGQRMTKAEFEDAWAIAGILGREIKKSGSFYEARENYGFAFAKGKKIAAHLMEASADDVVFEGGMFKVAGTDKEIDFGSVALTAYVPHNFPLEELEPGLEETAFYDPANFTYPAGSYVCEVEVDPDTGVVEVCSMHASDDFGEIINPMIVEGQVHGGLVQGIGQALLEQAVY